MFLHRTSHLGADGNLDLLAGAATEDQIAWYENLGTKVFANDFESETPDEMNLSCWSGGTP